MEIIEFGVDWCYTPELCNTCPFLERSIDEKQVACDSPEGICVKTGNQVYDFNHGLN